MDWIRNLNSTIDYIEEHIEDDISIDHLAGLSFSSKFHFLRVFTMLAGKPLGEYIRDRRMTRAANDVIHGDDKIIDLAAKYQYTSPESFTKAFKRFHGVSPIIARREKLVLQAAPPLRFQIDVKGAKRMKYRIEEKDGFKLIGTSRVVSMSNEKNYEMVPQFWNELWENGTTQQLIKEKGPLQVPGVCHDFDYDKEEFTYTAAVEFRPELEGKYETILDIPSSTWAIFEGDQLGEMQPTWKRIFSEWFPATGYELLLTPEIELSYPENEDGTTNWEIWIPIKLPS